MKNIIYYIGIILLYGCGITEPYIEPVEPVVINKLVSQDKVEMCYKINNEGFYHKIYVPEPLQEFLFKKGALYPGEDIPEMPGFMLSSECKPIFKCPTHVNYEGIQYETVTIGNQCWLRKNLNVGKMILSEEETFNNNIIEKYCYDNDSINCEIYGGLYTWEEAMQYKTTEGTQGICPEGWRIPTIEDFKKLKEFVNGDGNDLKDFNLGNNTSGFSALFGGHLYWYNKKFYGKGVYGHFWSSSKRVGGPYGIYGMGLHCFSSEIYLVDHEPNSFSIRCIKDY